MVIFMPAGRRGTVPVGVSLLDAGRQLGVEIESICGGRQTCGRCQVQIEEGQFQKHRLVSRPENVSPAGEVEMDLLKRLGSSGRRLACAALVEGDVLVTVPEESQARKQIVRKAATERVIQVEPAVRQLVVEVAEATLEHPQGDWERLQTALREQWNLEVERVDPHVLRVLQAALRQANWQVTVTLWQDCEVLDVQPGYREGAFGLAVDVGSTTLAGYLCDLRTGRVLATESAMNPQVTYGEDLMSRVSYATSQPDGLGRMRRAVIGEINQLAGRAALAAGIKTRDIHEVVLVGNTVMHHILLGIDPVELGQAPFALAVHDALDIKARDLDLRLHPAANAHILPLEAGHVGADNVAVLLAEAIHQQDEQVLVIDIGTNGEILLGNRERVLSASSPTGPAFEGAQITHGMRAAPGAIERVRIDPASGEPRFKVIGSDEWIGPDMPALASGICGSGIIEAVAELFLAGIVRPDGRIDPQASGPRIVRTGRVVHYVLATAEQTSTGAAIVVSQTDIRAIQLAKAALYSGIRLLMKRAGLQKVDRIVLAGAFGSYISPLHAMALGLIPDCELERVTAVGNAAGDGARIALLNRERREEARWAARWVEYVETAAQPDFQAEFVAAMPLPHARDPFPHLADRLPAAPVQERGERRRQRRSERPGESASGARR